VGARDLRRRPARPAVDPQPRPRRGPVGTVDRNILGRSGAGRGMSMTSANLDYEQAGELKIGQVGIANLRVRTLDVEQLSREMRERVERAPKLFGRAPVIIDFGGLARMPDLATAQALLDGLRAAGVLPVGLSYGTRETEQLAEQLKLPLLAKFRAQYEPV